MVFSFLESLKIGRRLQCGLFFVCSLLSPKTDISIQKRALPTVTERKFLWLGGTTIESMTPEINLSQYAKVVLRDKELYLIPDG